MLEGLIILLITALIGGIKIKVYNDKQKARAYKCRANIVRNVDG